MRCLAQFMAFYFLLGSLLPGADFSQLSKIPAALQHYRLHQSLAAEQGATVSFYDFMGAHFWNPGHHDHGDEGQSHKELPLKHLHSFDHLVLQLSAIIAPTRVVKRHSPTEMPDRFLPHRHLTNIFRPPIQA